MDDEARLGGDWTLQRDFAVRSAGFPVDGLEVFGAPDEVERLRAVARAPRFREALTWQNPAAVVNAIDKVAQPAKPSKQRQREEIVALYWQRYCGKNDTIGFFGPLAWGRVVDDGAVTLRAGPVERERAVHLEAWGVQALAATLDPGLRIATGPRAEDDLRAALALHPARDPGLAALDRLVAARDALLAAAPCPDDAPPDAAASAEAAAPGADGAPPDAAANADDAAHRLMRALADLDATFTELTGREPTRNAGRAYGARTLAYVDAMRDVDVTVGPDLLAEVAPALQFLFEASRWFCGRVQTIARELIEGAVAEHGDGPFGPLAGRTLGAMMALPAPLHDAVAELQARAAALLEDPDPATLAERARTAFGDHEPAWREAVYQSVDIQLAAASAEAIAAGDYLAVIGDNHVGDNPLHQGLFAHRHPDPAGFLARFAADVGPRFALLLPPWGPGMQVDARGISVLPEDTIYIGLQPDAQAPGGARTWRPDELRLDGLDVVDHAGELRVSLLDVFALPTFVMAVRTFELFGGTEHAPRMTFGRTVLRRERWELGDVPLQADALPAWARSHGMPRRVFVKTPEERKPFFLDLDSPILCRIAARHIRRAGGAPIAFSEMLPEPDACWLADDTGRRYASELRFVAVDRTVRGGA